MNHKNECKQHCKCYEEMIKKRRESGRKGAEVTNKKYTTEMRKKAGKKAWENRRLKKSLI